MEDYMVQSFGEKGEASGSNDMIQTIHDIMMEKGPKATKLMTNLTNVLHVKKRNLDAVERKYTETRKTIGKLIAENDKLHQSYYEEMKEMQFSIQEHFQWIFNDHEISNVELGKQQRELELRSSELQKHEVSIEEDRKNLAKEIQEDADNNDSLHQQRTSNKRKMKLVDDHKMEMEILHEKIFSLEKQLNAKQPLEVDLEHGKGSLNVLERTKDVEVHQTIEDLHCKLKETEEELEDLESLSRHLIEKEQLSNYELQEARKVLIEGLNELPKVGDVGVKWMCNEKEAKDLASELCSVWQECLQDPNWHPFKEGTVEDDEKVKNLKRCLGDKVYKVVMAAWAEINDGNSSGRYVMMELWNFAKSRKAILEEGASCLNKLWDTQKRRRIT